MCVYYNTHNEVYNKVKCGECPCEVLCSHSEEPIFKCAVEIITKSVEYGFEMATKAGLIHEE